MSRILLSEITDDLLQMISQYSMEVYFKLRLVSKAVKKVIDEVLPIGQDEDDENGETRFLHRQWRVKFLNRAHWCGFKLLDQRGFDAWMGAMGCAFYTKCDRGDIVEKFCRDYLPKNGCIGQNALDILCRLNRKDYVRELWEEAKHRFKSIAERFSPDCIECISMLKDFEFFKTVYDVEAFGHDDNRLFVYLQAANNSYSCRSWKNYRYLVEVVPISTSADVYDFKHQPFFKILRDYWKWLPDIKSQDKDKVMKVIQQNGGLLLFVDESFRKDKDVVMTAVKQDGKTIEFAHEALRKDKDIVMEAVKKTCDALEFAHESLRRDRDIVMISVTESYFKSTLKYAHESLRNDKDIVMAAVKNQIGSLEFAHESLRKDRDIVIAAMKNHGSQLKFAHHSLRKDKDFVLQVINIGVRGDPLRFVDESLQKDRDIVMAAVKRAGSQLKFAHPSLRKDKDIVLQAIGVVGFPFRYADVSLRRDPEVVLTFFKDPRHRTDLQFADPSLFQDEEFILQALKLDDHFLKYVHDSVKKDKEIVMRVVKLNGKSLQYADGSLQNDPDILLLASKQHH